MANPEHLKILNRGVGVWNSWRKEHFRRRLDSCLPNTWRRPDLTSADLVQRDLQRIDLRGVRLENATLRDSDLRHARLGGACLFHADLRADLRIANFRGADLELADLTGADLRGTNFYDAGLDRAIFRTAELSGADLRGAHFGRADLSEARTSYTVFGFNDLSAVKGLETVVHLGPSTIGIDTIYKSQGNIPEVFLRGCGVPEDFITYMKSLVGKAIEFYSCFISYSSKDDDFAQRLYADLQARNVRCWKFDENAKWGEPVWGEIDRSIRLYDKLVVICSENSLQSEPVIREIERALQREDRDKKNILFPVRIDDYLFEKWDHPRKADVVSKTVGDLRRWKNADDYTKAFKRFLDALNRPQENL
jgi:uncharacterized protein YjbI with pentapeptide repeats